MGVWGLKALPVSASALVWYAWSALRCSRGSRSDWPFSHDSDEHWGRGELVGGGVGWGWREGHLGRRTGGGGRRGGTWSRRGGSRHLARHAATSASPHRAHSLAPDVCRPVGRSLAQAVPRRRAGMRAEAPGAVRAAVPLPVHAQAMRRAGNWRTRRCESPRRGRLVLWRGSPVSIVRARADEVRPAHPPARTVGAGLPRPRRGEGSRLPGRGKHAAGSGRRLAGRRWSAAGPPRVLLRRRPTPRRAASSTTPAHRGGG